MIASLVTATFIALSVANLGTGGVVDKSWSDELFETLSIDFGTVARGYCVKTIKVTNTLDTAVHIRNVDSRGRLDSRARHVEMKVDKPSAKCQNRDLELRLEEAHRDRTAQGHATVGYKLFVSLRPNAPPGRLTESIELEINDKYRHDRSRCCSE